MIKSLIQTGILAIATMSANAGNISKQAMLLCDQRMVNEGKAYDILTPLNSKVLWQNMRPMSGGAQLDIWFPLSKPITLSGISAVSRHEQANVEFLARVNGKYVEKDKAAKLSFKLKSPVETNAVQFKFSNITNKDHDVLTYFDWKINGNSDGKKLYDSADMTLTCNAKFNVFDLPAPVKLNIELKDRIKLIDEYRLSADMRTFQGDLVRTEKNIKTFSLKGEDKITVPLKFAFDRQGPYLVSVYLFDKKRDILVAAKRIMVGLRDSKLFEKGIIEEFKSPGYGGEIISIDERLRRNGTIWSADGSQSVAGRGRQPGKAFFKKIKDNGGEMLMSYLRYSDFEPLPGVYNFDYFDHIVKNAGEVGLGLNAGIWWWDFRGPTQYWMASERIYPDKKGASTGWKGIYSVHSPMFRAHAMRAAELLVKRYNKCPEIWFWYPHPYGAVDHDGHGVKDYSPAAMKGWATYLKNKYKTLDQLNKIYKSSYKKWNELSIPESPYERLNKQGKLDEATRVLNDDQAWIDWLDFYHQGLLDMRVDIMKLIRKYDSKRGIGGVNATGGVGKTHEIFKAMHDYSAFYGDQGLNINHQVRRLVAKRQYKLRLRHEDIAPVTLGRRSFTPEKIEDRCNWLAFQCTFLSLDHFNYVFTAWTKSPFWNMFFTNPAAKKMVKEAHKNKFVPRKVAYLHSFLSDILVGQYNYNGISIYRWWLMNGFSKAIQSPGNFMEIMSLEGDLSALKDMKLAIDDGSRIMTRKAADAIVEFVKNGGKLALLGPGGQKTVGDSKNFNLLKRLGYGDTSGLMKRNTDAATLTFNNKNGIFRKTITIAVNFWCPLTVPKNGKAIGYIGDKVGAVSWPCGKGEIVLLAGLIGAVPESLGLTLYEKYRASGKKKFTEYRDVWANGERELGAISTSLSKDLAEWAGVPPLFSLNEDIKSCLKSNNGTYYVYMYNNNPPLVPVFSAELPQGKYKVISETLTSKKELGVFDSKDISAPGIRLPKLGTYRFMMLRLKPEK